MKTKQNGTSLPLIQLAFDVGHSSLGWAVLEVSRQRADDAPPLILGCGAVIFGADDCLASQRRAYRRQRRHIRSTRQRISRLKTLIAHAGTLDTAQLDRVSSSAPFVFAARVLAADDSLSWPQLWDVLRWYAHNRGYDGNRKWSAAEAASLKEDTEKVENARTLMEKHGAKSMAETFCRELGIDPRQKKQSSRVRFKGLNAAFPREVVEHEVRQILAAHEGKLTAVNSDFVRALLDDWRAALCPGLKLPARFQGGVLFGQLVPRYDNRIIAVCPVSGGKVPSRDCAEFFRFRWAMQLANIRVAASGTDDLRPLNVEQRNALDARMRERGFLTAEGLKKAVRELSGSARDNLETMLMHPDAKEALLLDPVQKLITSGVLKTVWPLLAEPVQKRVRGKLRRFKTLTLGKLIEGNAAAAQAVQHHLDRANVQKRKKDKPASREQLLAEPIQIRPLGRRAAYARPVLQQAFQEVMGGLSAPCASVCPSRNWNQGKARSSLPG